MERENIINTIATRLKQKKRTRILALGASCTQRRSAGTHWLDCLELCLNKTYGPYTTMINSGVGGDSVEMLLARFEEDAAFYKPHLTIVTIGGNDAVGENKLPLERFSKKLKQLHQQLVDLGSLVIFQTYYAFNRQKIGETGWRRFNDYMQIVRDTAHETESGLMDHLKRWAPLQERKPDLYYSLMLDAWHVNRRGNLVIGIDVIRSFKLDPFYESNPAIVNNDDDFWTEPIKIAEMMDLLVGER